MDRLWILKLFVSVSLLGGVCHCFRVTVQERVTAIKGSCVLLPCRTDPYKDVCWYKYQSSGYPAVYCTDNSKIIPEFKGRTSVPGNAQNGNCSLKIDNVRQEDSEVQMYVYIWKHDGKDQWFYATNERVKINILEPTAPEMTVTSTPTEGKSFSATCRFRHSCRSSPPQISWLGLNPTSVVLNHIVETDGLWVNEATFTVTRQNQNTNLSCWSSLSGQTLSSNQVSLNVLYTPSILPGSFCSTKNGTIQCVCQSEANPSAVISWTIDGSNALNPPFKNITQHNGTMTVSELTGTSAHNVTCTATNSVGDDFIQIPVHSEGNTPALLIGGVAGAAGLFIIFALAVTAIVICKKRRYVTPAEQQVKPDKVSHEYKMSDEDVYANTVPGPLVPEVKNRDPSIHASYDHHVYEV